MHGKPVHGGVALFWKKCFKHRWKESSFYSQCIQYIPASSHCIEEFNEYLDYLWALYDSLSTDGFVIIMGNLNGDLGNSLGDKGCYAPNDRGLKLLDFANLSICSGPLETCFLL